MLRTLPTSATVAALAGALGMLTGCTSSTEAGVVELSDLCDSPELYDGEMVTIDVELREDSVFTIGSSLALCDEVTPCCNSGFRIHQLSCADKDESVLLLPLAEGSGFDSEEGDPYVCGGPVTGDLSGGDADDACAAPTCPTTGSTRVLGVFTLSDRAYLNRMTFKPVAPPEPAP